MPRRAPMRNRLHRGRAILRGQDPRVIIAGRFTLGGRMRKQFVVPVLREEAALARLTLTTEAVSGRGGASCGSVCSGGSAG